MNLFPSRRIMTKNEVLKKIKDIWNNEIIAKEYEDLNYKASYLLREDTLKCSLYYHLRNWIEKEKAVNIRVFAEYPEFNRGRERRYRPDLVIVKLRPEDKRTGDIVSDIDEFLAIIEIKYQGHNMNSSASYRDDCNKLVKYQGLFSKSDLKQRKDPKLIGLFLFEKKLDHDIADKWLENKKYDDKNIYRFVYYRDKASKDLIKFISKNYP